jgi:hypothetical protein
MSWKSRSRNYANSKYHESAGHYYGASRFNRGGRIIGGFGRAGENTLHAISGSWNQLSWKIRGLLAFVLTFAILFIPFGVFQYAGWSMYMVFTWIINGFYWFVATVMNALLNVFVTVIDSIFQYVTEYIGGTYQSLDSWQITSGTLLDPDVFKPDEFDDRYLLQWVMDNFGDSIRDMFDFLKR